MLGNDRMETASTEITLIRRRNGIKKSTLKTHQYFVHFESRIHVEIDEISKNFPLAISLSDRWWIDKNVSIGFPEFNLTKTLLDRFWKVQSNENLVEEVYQFSVHILIQNWYYYEIIICHVRIFHEKERR